MDRSEAHLRTARRGERVQFCPPIMCNLEPPLTRLKLARDARCKAQEEEGL